MAVSNHALTKINNNFVTQFINSHAGLIGATLTTIVGGLSLVENGNGQTVTLAVTGNSESQGRTVQSGTNYWQASVYLATGTISNPTAISGTNTIANVPASMVNTPWLSGGTISLSGITVVLDLNGVGSCDVIDLLCLSLSRNEASTLMFTIEGGNITSCAPVLCIGKYFGK